jgi:hypothetical protein
LDSPLALCFIKEKRSGMAQEFTDRRRRRHRRTRRRHRRMRSRLKTRRRSCRFHGKCLKLPQGRDFCCHSTGERCNIAYGAVENAELTTDAAASDPEDWEV